MTKGPQLIAAVAAILALAALASITGAASSGCGQVASGSFGWTPQNFPGFYYDIDKNTGTERITANVTNVRTLNGSKPYGLIYNTTAQPVHFEFELWGSYNVIGFLGGRYFAGYVGDNESPDDILFEESEDPDVLSDGQLLNVLIDDDEERTITANEPLRLEDGYTLAVRSIDIEGDKVHLELSRNGETVDSKVISPTVGGSSMRGEVYSEGDTYVETEDEEEHYLVLEHTGIARGRKLMADETYYFKRDVGDSKDLVMIAVHFKSAFKGNGQELATIDGVWQLSDEFTDVSEDKEFGEMEVTDVAADAITMANRDNDITLGKGRVVDVAPGLYFRVADSDELRYQLCG